MNDDDLTTLLKEPFADVHMTMPLDQVARRGRAVLTRRRRLRGLTGAVALVGTAAGAVALLVPGSYPITARLAAWTVTTFPDGGIKVTVNQMKNAAGLQATLRADGIAARVTFDPVNAMTQPLPAGCTAPHMSDRANAQIQTKILTPPAIWSWQHQRQNQPVMHLPAHITYTINGHVEHATVPARDRRLNWVTGFQQVTKREVQQLTKGRPSHITLPRGLGESPALPSSLQTLQEKETQDAAGRSALYVNPAAIPAGIGLSIGVDVASPSSFQFGVDLAVSSPQCTGS